MSIEEPIELWRTLARSLIMTNGLNAYWTVDTSFVVAAPTTSHYVGEWNGLHGVGNAPTAIRSAAVSAVFANGARSSGTGSVVN